MSEAAAIERVFRTTLPSKLHDDAARLAQILADVADGVLSPDAASEQIQAVPALIESIRDLDGKIVNTRQSVLSFGEASQAGDVTIGSLVGGHQISLIINPPPPPRSKWPLWATFGTLVILAGSLTLWSYAPSLAPSIPDIPNSAAAPAAATPSTSAAQAFAERCIAEHQLDLAAERIFLMEAGTNIFILGPDDRRDQPIALALSEDGQPLALVVLDIVQGQSYTVRAVLDAGCQPLPDSSFSNAEPSRLHMLQAWDNLLLCLASGAYRIRVGAPSHTPVEILSRLVGEGVSCPL